MIRTCLGGCINIQYMTGMPLSGVSVSRVPEMDGELATRTLVYHPQGPSSLPKALEEAMRIIPN